MGEIVIDVGRKKLSSGTTIASFEGADVFGVFQFNSVALAAQRAYRRLSLSMALAPTSMFFCTYSFVQMSPVSLVAVISEKVQSIRSCK